MTRKTWFLLGLTVAVAAGAVSGPMWAPRAIDTITPSGFATFRDPPPPQGPTGCGAGWQHNNQTVYTCDLWPKAPIWVHACPDTTSPVVGYLNESGKANWFVSQTPGPTYRENGYTNIWYGRTMTDGNHRWGYVPEVYFRRGADNQPDNYLPKEYGIPAGCPGVDGSAGAGSGAATAAKPPAPPIPTGQPPTSDVCGGRTDIRLRRAEATAELAPAGGSSARSAAAAAQKGDEAEIPQVAGMDAEKDLIIIGTKQNCIHRSGQQVWGRTLLTLWPDWRIAHQPLELETTLTDPAGHQTRGYLSAVYKPGCSSLDGPGFWSTDPHFCHTGGDSIFSAPPPRWYLTRADGSVSSGQTDSSMLKADKPAGSVYVWDTRPQPATSGGVYTVDTNVTAMTAASFTDYQYAIGDANRVYAGWMPEPGESSRAKAMAGLTFRWDGGPLQLP